ncbi:MAG: hypothetical protein MJ230_03350 [bacterium]|nr:hypothetical protein [bacterium]
MKRILFLIAYILFLSCGFANAKSDDFNMPFIKFNGSKFSLYYSAKSFETGGFINEYYKHNQTYTNWNELIGIHHYPTAFYPIEHAKEFKDYLSEIGSSVSVEVSEEDNSALLYFIVISDKRLPIVLEFNIFKYVKSPLCGTVAFQYAKRYLLNNGLEVESIIKELNKTATKYVKQAEKVDMPDIITFEIEKGQYVHPEDIAKISKKQNKKDKPKIINLDKIDIDADVFANIQEEETKNYQFELEGENLEKYINEECFSDKKIKEYRF